VTKKTLLLSLLVLVLISCTGDQGAIDRAKADRIRQETADESAARVATEARRQADWEKNRDAAHFTKSAVMKILVIALMVLLVVVLFLFWDMGRATSDAWRTYAGKRAELAAGRFEVDRETRTFPALVADNAVHNLETGQVYRLGVPQLPDPQQVAVSGQVRALGVAAQAAERIGKKTEDARAADALPGLGASIPLVLPPGESTLIVESDVGETVDL
jgi:hypothetical protein